MFRLIILLILSAFITTGCATVNRGIDDHFRIDTVPQGAKITTSIETRESIRKRRKNKNLTPEYEGCNPTPCAIQLSRLAEFTFTVENEGYEPVEMYISSSNKKGSATANTAATVATTAGTVAVGAASTAAYALGVAQVSGAILYGTGSVLTLGLIPVETAVSAGIAAGTAIAPSTASLATAAVPPALAVTGGMLLIDAGTGANKNLYPNPVVLELAPKGSPVKYDPTVNLFKEREAAENKYDDACKLTNARTSVYKKSEECRALNAEFRKKREALKVFLSPPKKSNDTNSSAQTLETK